ncbi:MAG: hypothetical protein RLZZ210_1555 [Pseudomonadota bacterium]|jgi:uncharacterized short protein YbdD (DUF466 family)
MSEQNTNKIGTYLGKAVQLARLMVGIPNYDAYCKHMQENHSEKQMMTYEEFFKYSQVSRFGGNGKFKCC